MSNLLLGSVVVLLDDPLGGVVVSDGQTQEPLTDETLQLINDSSPVWLVSDRRTLRRVMRRGGRPTRCVCLPDYNRLLDQAGAPKVPLPDPMRPAAMIEAANQVGYHLRDHGLARVAKLESLFLPVCEQLQATGLPIDLGAWDDVLAAAHQRALHEARSQLTTMVGRDLGGIPT